MTKVKIGTPPIISAMSALVVRCAAAPSSRNGATWPASDIAAIRPHSRGSRGQDRRIASAATTSAAAAMAARPNAMEAGSNVLDAILISRNDEPHSSERKARMA